MNTSEFPATFDLYVIDSCVLRRTAKKIVHAEIRKPEIFPLVALTVSKRKTEFSFPSTRLMTLIVPRIWDRCSDCKT